VPRFAILRHESPHGVHFDLMLELDGVLKTWAMPLPPTLGEETDCETLPDHRIEYLDYEGPISGDRGDVTRWDHGVYTTESRSDDEWVVQFTGEKLVARASFLRSSTTLNRWRASFNGG
jgi:hypothetical protein